MPTYSSYEKLKNDLFFGIDPYSGFNANRHRPDQQGWNSNHAYLARSVIEKLPSLIIEIGAWKGMSTITLASAIKDNRLDAVVLSVDTWLGSWEHYEEPSYYPSLLIKNGYPGMYNTFLTNVVEYGLNKYVLPLPLDSNNAAVLIKNKNIVAQIIHLDAGHDYNAVTNDLTLWWDVLADEGIMIVDDYDLEGNSWQSVQKAVDNFLKKTPHVNFQCENNKCRFTKPTSNLGIVGDHGNNSCLDITVVT